MPHQYWVGFFVGNTYDFVPTCLGVMFGLEIPTAERHAITAVTLIVVPHLIGTTTFTQGASHPPMFHSFTLNGLGVFKLGFGFLKAVHAYVIALPVVMTYWTVFSCACHKNLLFKDTCFRINQRRLPRPRMVLACTHHTPPTARDVSTYPMTPRSRQSAPPRSRA